MITPATIRTAVEVGGLLSNLVARWNEYQAEGHINDAHAYLQRIGPMVQEQRAYMIQGLGDLATYYGNRFKAVEIHYCHGLYGLEMTLPQPVYNFMNEHVFPKFSALENLSNINTAVMPGVYRQVQSSIPADTAVAALLYGLADGIEDFMQSNGLRLSAKQYYEQCLQMGRQAVQALDDAVDGINAFFEMLAAYEGLKDWVYDRINSGDRWEDMCEEMRLYIRHFYGLFKLLVDFWDYAKALLDSPEG